MDGTMDALLNGLRAEKRLSKRGIGLIDSIQEAIHQQQNENSQLRDVLQGLIDQQFRTEGMIYLKAPGNVSIKIDRKNALNSSSFISTALSTGIGGDNADENGKSEIKMESDSPYLLSILALLITVV